MEGLLKIVIFEGRSVFTLNAKSLASKNLATCLIKALNTLKTVKKK